MYEAEEEVDDHGFETLGLNASLLSNIKLLGYEEATPVQRAAIPAMLRGANVIAQAQTGTGKTAAFALPIINDLDRARAVTQAIVIAPTRELAIQVCEAFQTYGRASGGIRVLPIYGGQPYPIQLAGLRRGAHVVVGTPGRVIDHLERGTLNLGDVTSVVLDEADEMLRMGFIDDVEKILSHAPATCRRALFSATMPDRIRRIAERYLSDAVHITVERKTLTVPTIEQRYVRVSHRNKLEALMRILEAEEVEASIIFGRTQNGVAELTERLSARGYNVEALHGGISQAHRERIVRRFRDRQLDLVVATDVAARGLDVDHISHVINYDIPHDVESYVHRIGRTGRAGRSGVAILFVTPRERRMMQDIERYTGQKITAVRLPSLADVAARRVTSFKAQLGETLQSEDLDFYRDLVAQVSEDLEIDVTTLAAGVIRMLAGEVPFEPDEHDALREPFGFDDEGGRGRRTNDQAQRPPRKPPADRSPGGSHELGMVRVVVTVGKRNGARPSDLVGAISNIAGISGRAIGAISIHENITFVDVPEEIGDDVIEKVTGAVIRGRQVQVTRASDKPNPGDNRPRKGGGRGPFRGKKKGGHGRH